MEELSIEEKAKRYDELFVKAKQIYNKENDVLILHTIEDFFPKLKESEDEKIRKAIIGFFSEPGRKEYILNGFTVDDIIAWLEKQGGNKSVEWCKNDDVMLKQLIGFFEDKDTILQHDANLYAGWLKSIKDRVVPQPKQEWSEENEAIKKELISYLAKKKSRETDGYAIWLKSLKPQKSQNVWKPSDEQIIAVNTAINVLGKGTLNGKQLIELQEQLKRLKRE